MDAFERIASVIRHADPSGLLKVGAPLDEYDDEIREIFTRRNECRDVDSCHEVVWQVFQRAFGESDEARPLYRRLAEEVFTALDRG